MVGKLNEIIASLQKLQKDTQQVSSNSAAIQQQVYSSQKAAADAIEDRERAERRAKRAKSHPGW